MKTVDVACRLWLLEGSEPPTLLLPEQEGIRGIRFPVWLDKTGKRVAADCPDATEKVTDVWPLPLEPWLPAAEKERRVSRQHQQFVRLWITAISRRLCCQGSEREPSSSVFRVRQL